MKAIILNNCKELPLLGFGTCKSENADDVYRAVRLAIDIGYRHIDCSQVDENEKEIGKAIQSKITEGVVRRDELFISSKLWSTCHRSDLVEDALNVTLRDLQLDYIDLYLIHLPMALKDGHDLFPVDKNDKLQYSNDDFVETWKIMEDMVSKGLVKNIGLSNFNSLQINRILQAAIIKPVINQVECHPYLNQKKLMEFCCQNNILITAYSPLGTVSRFLSNENTPELLDDIKLITIAEKYGKTVSQILIRYQIDRGNAVIANAISDESILANFQVFDFELNGDDLELLDEIDCNYRFFKMEELIDHPNYPFNVEF